MLEKCAVAFGMATLAACTSPPAKASSGTEPAPGDAILVWAREQHGEQVYQPVPTFYGDFTGDGVIDALAWVLYPSGGNSDLLDVALFRNLGGRLVYYRSVENVFGSHPHAVVFEQDRITLTTTMPKPGDSRCCPTGSRHWVIDTR